MCALSILLGGHVGTGLEDAVYYLRGRKAPSNAQLVERVVALASLLGATSRRPRLRRDARPSRRPHYVCEAR